MVARHLVGSSRLWRLRCRPFVGLLIRDRVLVAPSRTYWIVRNPRTGLYWRDPYHVRDTGVEWGPYTRAWRFPTRDLAVEHMAGEHVTGETLEIPLP